MKKLLLLLMFLFAVTAHAEDPWVGTASDGTLVIRLTFFWSLSCPHCIAAHPHIRALARAQPWILLEEREVSQDAGNARRFEDLVIASGNTAQAGVPAFLFCGEMHFGWDSEQGMGAQLQQRLAACHERVLAGQPAAGVVAEVPAGATQVDLPWFGRVNAESLSLPVLTLVLAGLDAFNPCAFFVLLFLLSMMAHQQSRTRMLVIGGVFITVSGLMYFAFMAAWLNVFQLFGQLAGVTLAAGVVALLVGAMNVKDFFFFGRGPSLSIPDQRKAALGQRIRRILAAESLPAMLFATLVLAVAANFYELLCTAGFPLVYTRLLTLADLPAAARYAYLALYNLIYVVPLAVIVVVFARTLGARRLSEREGRLLKLLSGLMMLELGGLLLLAPQRIGQVGIAFGLMALAVGLTALAARLTRNVRG